MVSPGNQSSCTRDAQASFRGVFFTRTLRLFIGILTIAVVMSETAQAQFVVQPMKVKLSVRAGQIKQETVLLQNIRGTSDRPVIVAIEELYQNDKGEWTSADDVNSIEDMVDGSVEDLLKRSCRSWISLNRTNYTLAANGTQKIDLMIRIPPGVRGFYCAAFTATIIPEDKGGAIGFKYKLVVPVLIEIEGTPQIHRIALEDVIVNPLTETEDENSTELEFFVTNTGETMATVLAKGWIKYWDSNNKRWKPVVSEIDMMQGDLIPGTKARFRQDIGKELPSGRYKLLGALNVDGRESKIFDKEIDYVGPPGADLIEDNAIRCATNFVQIEGQRGRFRRSTVELRNYSFNPVTVRAVARTPEVMKGKIWYGVKGEDMSCADWLEVKPQEVRLKPFGSRNVSVVAKIPENAPESKGYYADLIFNAEYDGKGDSAGSASILVCTMDQKAESKANINGEHLKLTRMDESDQKYIVGATFGNLGNVHIMPKVYTQLIESTNQLAIMERPLSNAAQKGAFLPYEKRVFSAVINLSLVDDGNYKLKAFMAEAEDGTQLASIEKSLKIYHVGVRRVVEIVGSDEEQAEVGSEAPTYSW